MITDTPGVGSIYLATYRDKEGGWLDGSKSYHLRIPPNPPSRSEKLQKNADGSVDLYFGPTAPKDKESNWVETVSGRYWFPYFRMYAPTEAYFDRSWPLPDIDRVK